MWGIGHRADRRTDEVFRYLSRLQIKVPREIRKTSGSPSSKKVPVKVAHALARKYATSVSPKLLAWAARQAALLSPTISRIGSLTRASFIRGLDEIFDFAGSSLVLSGKYPNYRASRVNLLSLSAAQAASQSSKYHALLKRIQAGTIQLRFDEDPYFVGAALGVSPGALRSINGSRRIDKMLADYRSARLTISPPQPLKYRHEVFRLPKGRAIVWVHPDDKGRVGAGYGWCVSDNSIWRNKLQFAVVGPENRPKALITMRLVNPSGGALRGGDDNRFVRVAPNGRAFVDLRAIAKEGGGIQWGELKGLYNQITPDEPYRSDIRKWVAKQPFGAFRTAARNDWIKVLVTQDDIPETRKMLRRAGGHPTLMSLADSGSGPSQFAADAFGDDLGSWLRSPVAPLVLATMNPLQVKKIAPNLPAALRGERFRRALKTTPGAMKRDFIVDYSLARRAGVPLPSSQVKGFRALLAKTRAASLAVSLRQALTVIRASADAKAGKPFASVSRSDKGTGPLTEAEWTAMWKLFDERPASIPDFFWVRATGSRDESVLSLLSNLLLAATENPRGKPTARLMRDQSIAITKVARLAVNIGEGDPEPGGWGHEEDPVGEPYGDDQPGSRGRQVSGDEGWHCLSCSGLAAASNKPQDRGAIPPSVALGLFYPAVLDAWEIRPWFFDASELGAMLRATRTTTRDFGEPSWEEQLYESILEMGHNIFEEEDAFGTLEPLARAPLKKLLDEEGATDLAGGWVPGRQDRVFEKILKSAVNPVAKLRALALAGAWPVE